MLEHYQKHFYAVHAKTPELKAIAYRLRYQVYAMEYGDHVFKTGQDQIETDEYDDEALHGLLFYKPTDTPVGCFRVVPYNEKTNKKLPLEHICHDFNKNILTDLRTKGAGEVSRMAIQSSFRRRSYDSSSFRKDNSAPALSKINRRSNLNYLPFCLTLMGILLCQEANLSYSVALMEPRLARLFKIFGLQPIQIGKVIEFYGQRAPFIHYFQGSYDCLKPEYQELYMLIKEELNLNTETPQLPGFYSTQQSNYHINLR